MRTEHHQELIEAYSGLSDMEEEAAKFKQKRLDIPKGILRRIAECKKRLQRVLLGKAIKE